MHTDVTVDVKLDIGVVVPYDAACSAGNALKKQPETQEYDAQIPALANEPSHEHHQQHHGRYDIGDGEEGICRIDGAHIEWWVSELLMFKRNFIPVAFKGVPPSRYQLYSASPT